jgi:prophage tail gpP-like protein
VYSPAAPDKQTVRLRVMDEHVDLTRWTSYTFASQFLTPSDGWSCTVGDGDLSDRERSAILIGATVRLYLDNLPLAEGYIDSVSIDADRESGVQYTIEGRDRLGHAVDAVADPRQQFKEGTTLAQFLKELFAPFGWVTDDHFEIDNDANRSAKGGIRGVPMTKGGKRKGPRPLKDFVLHQLKPHNHEGVFAFASRVTQRHGLWIWCSADGDRLIVGRPDFTQAPRYHLRRTSRGDTNVLSGPVKFDLTDQPSVIVADGFSGGGEFGRGRIKAYCVNPYFGVDADGKVLDDVTKLLARYPDAEQVTMTVQPFKQRRRVGSPPIRPMFLHDDESRTQEQLNNFVRREMSLRLRKSMTVPYLVEGHGQTVDGNFVPFDIDTVADVHDEVAGIDERMYVAGRTFEKSRRGGTHTRLELVRLNSIQFGDSLLA